MTDAIFIAAKLIGALASIALLVLRVRAYRATRPKVLRAPRDLTPGLLIVGMVAAAAAMPAALSFDVTGRVPWWLIVPLLIPAVLLAVLLRNWSRGYWNTEDPR